ncbi:hypothetical protein FC066_19835 [Vibrio tasmaniensis]|nr:hypothetical protein FC060_21055 [Vibrio tasmaniensis]TKG55501.1 hypothetical protein FC070_00500 [Vibrio tasmaniensis]TKG58504.1 hypothetical protein FC066_19835 [Vibrio tasmaniensis]
MIAALPFKSIKWGKWLLIVVVGIAMGAMWLMLKVSQSELAALKTRLESALSTNQISQATIETLTQENSEANHLLVERARLHSTREGKLNEDIETLRRQLVDEECYQRSWPSDVVDRLREPY